MAFLVLAISMTGWANDKLGDGGVHTRDGTAKLDIAYLMSGAIEFDESRSSKPGSLVYQLYASLWGNIQPVDGWAFEDDEFDDPFGEDTPGRVWRATPSEQTGGGGAPVENLDAIAEALANPLSYLWMAFMQNDTIWYDGDIADALGEDAKRQNTFMFNPVLSMQLTEEWKMVFRPVIPINSFETVDNVNITTNPSSEGYGRRLPT